MNPIRKNEERLLREFECRMEALSILTELDPINLIKHISEKRNRDMPGLSEDKPKDTKSPTL